LIIARLSGSTLTLPLKRAGSAGRRTRIRVVVTGGAGITGEDLEIRDGRVRIGHDSPQKKRADAVDETSRLPRRPADERSQERIHRNIVAMSNSTM
jgi:hypothetical protein